MSFAADLQVDRCAYTQFKRCEIAYGFNLSVEGMKIILPGKFSVIAGLVLTPDPISGNVLIQWADKPHLQEVDLYALHKDNKNAFFMTCAITDPLWTPLAREHVASTGTEKRRRFAASDAVVKMFEEPPKFEMVTHKAKKARTSRRSIEEAHLICPITLQIMNDPVLAHDGHFYERWAIEKFMGDHGPGQLRSPVTRQPMRNTLRKSLAMKSIIDTSWKLGAGASSTAHAAGDDEEDEDENDE